MKPAGKVRGRMARLNKGGRSSARSAVRIQPDRHALVQTKASAYLRGLRPDRWKRREWVTRVEPSGRSARWRARPQQERLSLGWQLGLLRQERQPQEQMP
jgi:hypothetical protein